MWKKGVKHGISVEYILLTSYFKCSINKYSDA